jgi:tartrate/fumarate subfamily iron-sulfur-dependent hydro-lyase alpha chain
MVRRDALIEAIYQAVAEAAFTLRSDVRASLVSALDAEPSERGRSVIRQLLENADIAAADRVPLCQDTGTAWVRLTMGVDDAVPGDIQHLADEAVSAAYRDLGLRMSTVRDALLDRTNPGDNTPALVSLEVRPGRGARVEVMLKGGGSDNASALAMLPPSAGLAGVREFVLRTVEANATGACPPLLVGVAVGGTFDTVGALSKRALLRRIGTPSASAASEAIESGLLEAINATGIGPAGLGGRTTALAVHLVTAPCHIAALPVAVNLGCCAVRTAVVEIA